MRIALSGLSLLLLCSAAKAATPIDGLYSSLFAGYAYLPNNIAKLSNGNYLSKSSFKYGYDAGASLGYKSNPLRYEFELSYFNANLRHFFRNAVKQNPSSGYSNGLLGMANILYDFKAVIDSIQPYLGIGLGYGWFQSRFASLRPNSPFLYRPTGSALAYQALAGLNYQFAENYALGLGYRYAASNRIARFAKSFQGQMANLSVTYRYDGAHY